MATTKTMRQHDERRSPPAGRRSRGRRLRSPALPARQSAVLEAIKRNNGPSLVDVAEAVGLLPPSRTAKVVHALEARGLVRLEGDPALIYTGGVQLYAASPRSRPRSAECAELARLLRGEGLEVYDHDSGVAVKVPLADLEAELRREPAGLLDDLRRAIALAGGLGIRCSVSVNTRATNIRGVPALEVRIAPGQPPDEGAHP